MHIAAIYCYLGVTVNRCGTCACIERIIAVCIVRNCNFNIACVGDVIAIGCTVNVRAECAVIFKSDIYITLVRACSTVRDTERAADKTYGSSRTVNKCRLAAKCDMRVALKITPIVTADNRIVNASPAEVEVGVTLERRIVVTAVNIAEVAALYRDMCITDVGS